MVLLIFSFGEHQKSTVRLRERSTSTEMQPGNLERTGRDLLWFAMKLLFICFLINGHCMTLYFGFGHLV